MIKSVTLNNFQSHKKSTLNLSPGVNVIVGKSDSGKTAILRALNWVVMNRPSGDAFRSVWGGDTSVKLELDNGIVSREKYGKENQYTINDSVLKAMGQNVPDTVSSLLNMPHINIQSQMDAPFLLSSSAGEVAQTLNEVAGLADIDVAISNINRTVNQYKAAVAHKKSEISSLEAELIAFNGLDELDAKLGCLERLQGTVSSVRMREAALNVYIAGLEGIKPDIQCCEAITGVEIEYAHWQQLDSEASSLSDHIFNMGDIVTNGESSLKELNRLGKVVTMSGRADGLLKIDNRAEKIYNDCVKLEKLIADINESSVSLKRTDALSKLKIEPIVQMTIDRDNKKDIIKELQTGFTFIKNSLANIEALQDDVQAMSRKMPKECPLCGNVIK